MPLASTADLSKSAIHQLEAQTLGTRSPAAAANALTGSTSVVVSTTVTATVPTAGANGVTSVTATLTGAKLGDIVEISNATVALLHQAAVIASVTAADQITIVGFGDATGFTGAAKIYNVVLKRQSA